MFASDYRPYAERIASYGYLVLQYDLPFLAFVPDSKELRFARAIREAIPRIVKNLPVGPVDHSRMAAVGHSRGAKLSALHLAARVDDGVSCAFLVDPVDSGSDGGSTAPSALDALRDSGEARTTATVTRRRSGHCSPMTPLHSRPFSPLHSRQ